MTEYSIGLDLGGTNLRAAAIDRQGNMLNEVTGQTQYSEGRDAISALTENSSGCQRTTSSV